MALAVEREFGLASGLQLNLDKCTEVCVHKDGQGSMHTEMEITPAPASTLVR